MQIKIRPANAGDTEVLAETGAFTFYETFREYNSEEDIQAYLKKAYAIDVIRENLGREDISYFLALDEENKTIGYIKLIADAGYEGLSGKTIELEKIYVRKQYHGTAAGRELMACAIEHAREKGFDVLFLGVWNENERALHFYRKNGFVTFATRKFRLGQRICDDDMMKLELK